MKSFLCPAFLFVPVFVSCPDMHFFFFVTSVQRARVQVFVYGYPLIILLSLVIPAHISPGAVPSPLAGMKSMTQF